MESSTISFFCTFLFLPFFFFLISFSFGISLGQLIREYYGVDGVTMDPFVGVLSVGEEEESVLLSIS